jgi:hypothetical protein
MLNFEATDSQFIVKLFVPHNDFMPHSKARHRLQASPLCFPLQLNSWIPCVFLFAFLQALPSAARDRSDPAQDPGYVEALATADHFLQAWQSGDVGNGMALLTSHSKEKATTDVLENFFDGSRLSAYEIGRGKLIKRGRYEFPVVLVSAGEKGSRGRRRFSSVVVIDTGHNDWAVDKLP